MTRTEKLSERENRNQGEYFKHECRVSLITFPSFPFLFVVETTRIQKEFAVLDAKLEEHSRTSSELRRLQVNETTLHICPGQV